MSKQEFILLIPAIVYGVAIVDLLKSFQRRNYWEIPLWGAYLLADAIILWLSLWNQLDYIVNDNLNLILVLVQAILFAKAASLITPEEKDVDTKAYYEDVIKYVILLTGLAFAIAAINEWLIYDDRQNIFIRPISLVLAALAIFWQNKYYRWAFMAFVSISAIAILIGAIQ